MDLLEFFDITNVDHLSAYKHLTEHGAWPEGFIPDDCTFSPVWQYQLAEKMAVAYVNDKLNGASYNYVALERVRQILFKWRSTPMLEAGTFQSFLLKELNMIKGE